MRIAKHIFSRHKQFITFFIIGLFNTAFGYLLFASFIWSGLAYPVATLLANCLGILFNYFTIGKIVFNNKNHTLMWRFFLMYSCLYLINITIIKFANLIVHDLYISGMISMFSTALFGYFLNKTFIFTKTSISKKVPYKLNNPALQ